MPSILNSFANLVSWTERCERFDDASAFSAMLFAAFSTIFDIFWMLLLISLVVALCSSDATAIWFICDPRVLIWCSISFRALPDFAVSLFPTSTSFTPPSMDTTAFFISLCIVCIVSPICFVAPVVLSASLRTSSATTANPRPCSPARAASIAAFRARRFVCSAISLIIPAISPIWSERSPSLWIISADSLTLSSMRPMLRMISWMMFSPVTAELLAISELFAAAMQLFVISLAVADISSLAVATDVISVTMMSVPFAIWVAVASRVLTAKDIWLLESATPDSAVLTRPMNVLKFLPIAPNSPADDSSMRFVRSPCERLSKDLSRSFNGPRIALALQ